MNLVSFSLKTRAPDHILDDERSPLRELDLLVEQQWAVRYAAACLRVAQRTSRMYMEGTFTAQSYRTRHGWFLLYAGSNCLRTDPYSCTVSSYCTTSTGDCLY